MTVCAPVITRRMVPGSRPRVQARGLESARMRVGVLTGTGTYALDESGAAPERVATAYGDALVTRGEADGVEVLHISRHEEGHKRLSNQVQHRANIAALKELGAGAVLAVTVCGAVDPTVPLGS